jgi:hypothetical protein
MVTVWFFMAIQYGGMGNGIGLAQLGPFESEAACQEVAKHWVDSDATWRKVFPCYKGAAGKPYPGQ